jgi:hypothetical protein
VDGVEGDLQEERTVLVALDERDRLATDGISQIGRFLDRLGSPEDVGAPLGEVGVGSAEEPEELVEASLLRVELRGPAEVPLADEPRRVPGRFEAVGQGRLRQREAELVAPRLGRVELVAEPLLVATRQEPGAGRAAIGAGDVAVGTPDAPRRQGVEVRRGDVLATLKS